MSSKFKHGETVPSEILCARLNELSDAVTKGQATILREFDMRIPAELDRDADLVLSEAAMRIRALESQLAATQQRLTECEADAELKQECLEWLAEDCETETEYDGQMLTFCSVCAALIDNDTEHQDDCLHLKAKAAIDSARGGE